MHEIPDVYYTTIHTRLDYLPTHNKVCHGDLNPSNVIITEDGTPYIIDWSHAARGNASADAAQTYLLFWLNGDIEGAKKYGMKGFVFKAPDTTELRKALREQGVNI